MTAIFDNENRRQRKQHRWVGAYVLPLSEETARQMSERVYARPTQGGPRRTTPTSRTVPRLLDVYCEVCRQAYPVADDGCYGIVNTSGVGRSA